MCTGEANKPAARASGVARAARSPLEASAHAATMQPASARHSTAGVSSRPKAVTVAANSTMRAAAAKHCDSGSWSPVHAPAASDAAIQTGRERTPPWEQELGQVMHRTEVLCHTGR